MDPIRQFTRLTLVCIVLFGLPAAAQAAGPTVDIDNMAYAPTDVTVAVGESITWVNNDTAPHNAVARDNSWRTQVLQTGQNGTVTFEVAGSYAYYCSLHPAMIASVTVVESALPATDTDDAMSPAGERGQDAVSSMPWLIALVGLVVLAAVARQRMSSR